MTTIPQLYQHFLTCTGVSTDTRQITDGCLFVALRGDTFDGNTFAKKALEQGAAFVLVDRPEVVENERYLLVEDSLLALQQLANYHRKQFQIPVVGLTGSNGKTTTKELIAAVLSQKYNVLATKGNLNNHIGVPLTLLAINQNHEIAVIEMGANHQKEIEMLCQIAEPTIGLITNVGKAHLEGFGGVEGVRKGKGELYDFLAASGGTVFVNASNQILNDMAAERVFVNQIDYLNDTLPTLIEESPLIVFESIDNQIVTTHLNGRYNFENMAVALEIGAYFDVVSTDANEAVANYNPTNNRSQFVEKGTNRILMDAYNANPSSMAVAVQYFANMEASRKMVILGDMFELGNEAAAEHLALGKLIAEARFDVVILSGKLMHYALPALPTAYYFPDKFSLHNWLVDNPQQNTNILVKGSRGMGLETVLPYL
jgi:UDP-N-acetylmuramoyl-tripeptide--D-alanyl-D-alanine ligase